MRAEISKRAAALINLKIWNIVQIRKSLTDPDGRMPMSDSEAMLRERRMWLTEKLENVTTAMGALQVPVINWLQSRDVICGNMRPNGGGGRRDRTPTPETAFETALEIGTLQTACLDGREAAIGKDRHELDAALADMKGPKGRIRSNLPELFGCARRGSSEFQA